MCYLSTKSLTVSWVDKRVNLSLARFSLQLWVNLTTSFWLLSKSRDLCELLWVILWCFSVVTTFFVATIFGVFTSLGNTFLQALFLLWNYGYDLLLWHVWHLRVHQEQLEKSCTNAGSHNHFWTCTNFLLLPAKDAKPPTKCCILLVMVLYQ